MQKLHQKQLHRLKEQQKLTQQQYTNILTHMITTQQQLKEAILFSKDTFESLLSNQPNSSSHSSPFSLSDFTPSSISKLVFEEHLIKIRQEFDKLPGGEAKLEHFVLVMMKVLFVEPSRGLGKEVEEEILRRVVKEGNVRSGICGGKAGEKGKRQNSPKKIRQPPNLLKQQTLPPTKHPSKLLPSTDSHLQPPISHQFDKLPFYIIALHYMFKQILIPTHTTITFSQLQKFMMGEFLTSTKPTSNTEFTIQVQETKKQDFLLHDNGIKRLVYCKGLNIYLCLDTKQTSIKIYTSELKNKQSFQPNRLKHNRKSPEIVDMFYSDFGGMLGLVMADKSIEVVNFQAFMTRLYEKEFLPVAANEIVVRFDFMLRRIVFLQMWNKWLVVGEKNQLVVVDVAKFKSREEDIIITPIKNPKPQLFIAQIQQIIPLSTIIITAGNQLWFFDQKLSRHKYHSYIHQLNIASVKYYEQKNTFYLCGHQQKTLTLLKPQRGRQTMQTTSMPFSRPIMDFEVFSFFGSIVLVDDKHTVRLVSEETKQVYQVQEYGRIVKGKEGEEERKSITLLKLSRQHFLLSQSYIVSLTLAKVPIQTQIQFQFLPYLYFDPLKQDIYFSFNNQIMCVSLLQAEIRQAITMDNSNIEPLWYFYSGAAERWKPFVIDHQGKVYDVVVKQGETGVVESDLKKYKKKLDVKQMKYCTFDEELGRCLIVAGQQMLQVKNEKQNTFSTVNVINFVNLQVLSAGYATSTKTMHLTCLSSLGSPSTFTQTSQFEHLNTSSTPQNPLLSNNPFKSPSSPLSLQSYSHFPPPLHPQQFCLQINITQPLKYRVIKFDFEKLREGDKPEVVVRALWVEGWGVCVLLTDENVVYVVEVGGKEENEIEKSKKEEGKEEQGAIKRKRKFICIKVYHYIAPKVRDLLKFNELYLNQLKIKDPSSSMSSSARKGPTTYNSLFLTSQQGFFIEIKLTPILTQHFSKPTHPPSIHKPSTTSLSQSCTIDYLQFTQQQTLTIPLSKAVPYTFANPSQEFSLIKAHNGCKIEIVKKIQLEFLFTLTVGRDGFVKMWNQERECVVGLKLPGLRRDVFEVKNIEEIRGRRMMQQALTIVTKITSKIHHKPNLTQILHLTRHHEFDKAYDTVNPNDPIKIDIENKFIEEIVIEEPNYQTLIGDMAMGKRFRHHRYGDRIDGDERNDIKNHPQSQLRKQRSFQNILERSVIRDKNAITIPVELLELRKPLKKYERSQREKQQARSVDVTGFGNEGRLTSRVTKDELLILPKLREYKMESRYGKRSASQKKTHTPTPTQQSQHPFPTQEYDTFQPCAFVKNKPSTIKKSNELDRIDKEFIRKEYSMVVKKHLARKKDAVQVVTGRGVQEEKSEMEESGGVGVSLETILGDVKRLRYEARFGGERFIPKVRFKSYSGLG